MDYGNGVSQCFSQGFVQQLSDSRPRSYEDIHRAFQQGQEAGEGFGALLGVLIDIWIQHHRAVNAETRDLREQVASYQRAQDGIIESQIQMEQENARIYDQLSKLDPDRSQHWLDGAANTQELLSKVMSVYAQTQKLEQMELKEKSPKALRQVLDDPQHAVKWRLDLQRKIGFQSYVLHQFLVARLGMYTQQPAGSPTPVAPSFEANNSPATPGATAKVTVERTTANADVYLDGAFVGNTPTVLHVSSGNHVVRLTAGKDEWARTLAVSDGADLRLRPAM